MAVSTPLRCGDWLDQRVQWRLTIPSVSVGLASQSIGTKDATLYCAIVIGALALVALTAIRRGQEVPERTQA